MTETKIQLDEGILEIWGKYIKTGSPFIMGDLKKIASSVDHKNIVDWEREGLISFDREDSDAGWRRVSIVKALQFRILVECRDMKLSNLRIKKTLEHISEAEINAVAFSKETKAKRTLKLPALECVVIGLLSYKTSKIMLLLYDFDNGGAFIGYTTDVYEHYFNVLKARKPAILLPLSDYVFTILHILKKEVENNVNKNLNKDSIKSSSLKMSPKIQ